MSPRTWSDEHQWEPAFDRLRNARLSSIATYSRLPELDLGFDNRHHLLSFNVSDGQPGWYIIDKRSPESVTLKVDNGRLTIEQTQ